MLCYQINRSSFGYFPPFFPTLSKSGNNEEEQKLPYCNILLVSSVSDGGGRGELKLFFGRYVLPGFAKVWAT